MKKHSSFLEKHISDITYGGTDGIITTFVIVAGASGANLPKVALIIGLSSLFADSVSMGSSRFLSLRAELAVNKGVSNDYVKPLRHALVTIFSFMILGSIPLLGFVLPIYLLDNFLFSSILSVIALFTVGALRSKASGKHNFFKSGIETTLIGMTAGLVGFGIGAYLG